MQPLKPRFIPAPAGNSLVRRGAQRISVSSVHPRACGEQASEIFPTVGSLARFIPAPAGNRILQCQAKDDPTRIRFIPAACGEQDGGATGNTAQGGLSVHPRACGEQATGRIGARGQLGDGSSPRLRGTVTHVACTVRIGP